MTHNGLLSSVLLPASNDAVGCGSSKWLERAKSDVWSGGHATGNHLSTIRWMVQFALALVTYLRAFLISRPVLALETVALRQQLAVWKRQQPRPQLNRFDRLFWIALRHLWANWSKALILVKQRVDRAAVARGIPASLSLPIRLVRSRRQVRQ